MMDNLTPIVAVLGGLYDMVPWRDVFIGIAIVVWFWAAVKRAHTLGNKLDELGRKLDELGEKLDDRRSHREDRYEP